MTKININNYPEYWIDFLDGKLSDEIEQELFDFLEKHPDISSELCDPDFPPIAPDITVSYDDKNELKSGNIISHLIISKLENTLDANQAKLLEDKISKDKNLAEEFDLYSKTVIKPNLKIKYPFKQKLKRGSVFVKYEKAFYAIAATVTIILISQFYLSYFKNDLRNNLKEIQTITAGLNSVESLNIIENTKHTVENKKFKEEKNEETQVNTSEIKKVRDVLDLPKHDDETSIPEKSEFLENLALIEITPIENRMDYNINKFDFTEFENSSKEEVLFTIEIIKTPQKSKIKNVLNTVEYFVKRIDIGEKYRNLKLAKENLMLAILE